MEDGRRYLVGRVADRFYRLIVRRTVAAIRLAFLVGRGDRNPCGCGHTDLGGNAGAEPLVEAMADVTFRRSSIERK